MPRISKVTTKTGDDGSTGLADGSRIAKSSARICLLGELDELNANIGLCMSYLDKQDGSYLDLLQIQHDLFDLGAELCQPNKMLISDGYCTLLEQKLEQGFGQ